MISNLTSGRSFFLKPLVQLEMMYYTDRKWLGLIDVLSVMEQKSLGIEELEKLYVLKTKHY